ncbi:MAG: hypothetical protein EOP51_21885, partial [Sphingobacteriales bacterium]
RGRAPLFRTCDRSGYRRRRRLCAIGDARRRGYRDVGDRHDRHGGRLLPHQRHAVARAGRFLAAAPCRSAAARAAEDQHELSAAHDIAHLDKAIAAFTKVGKELGVIK